MKFAQFNTLRIKLFRDGKASDPPVSVGTEIRRKYLDLLGERNVSSDGVIMSLVEVYPEVNVPEVLRPVVDFRRE
ncbi:hypothetical protein ACFL3M_02950 [Patescibacteria group bacterium]